MPLELSEEKKSQCLAMVEIALQRNNQAEAIAAINRTFEPAELPTGKPIDWLVVDLELRPRTTMMLEQHGIVSVRQLCDYNGATILSWPQVGPNTIKEIREALRRVGLSLRKMSIDQTVDS